MRELAWALNVLGWPVIQLGIGGVVLRWPAAPFLDDSWITRERCWERRGDLYRQAFAIQRWKRHLPDGAPWLGGTAKKRLAARSPEYLKTLIMETRRAEIGHWSMLLCVPLFFLWNPPWACAVMAGYGLLANVPCILAQRSNRIQVARMLRRQGDKHSLAAEGGGLTWRATGKGTHREADPAGPSIANRYCRNIDPLAAGRAEAESVVTPGRR
jgi:glycosyl-4,4'-diaponeurosporenoate acyltransferase